MNLKTNNKSLRIFGFTQKKKSLVTRAVDMNSSQNISWTCPTGEQSYFQKNKMAVKDAVYPKHWSS